MRLDTMSDRVLNKLVIKNMAITALSALLNKGIAIIFLPLILAFLSPAEYGFFSLVTAFVQGLSILLSFGLRQVLAVEYFHYSGLQQQELMQRIILLYGCCAVPLLIITALAFPFLNPSFFASQASWLIMLIALCWAAMLFVQELFLQVLRYQGKAVTVARVQTITAVGAFILALILLRWCGVGVIALIGCYTARVVFCALWAWYESAVSVSFAMPSFVQAKEYLFKGIFFIPGLFASWVFSSSARIILALYVPLEQVGLYATADALAQSFDLIILYPLVSFYVPEVMKRFAHNKQDVELIERHNKQVMWGVMGALFILLPGAATLGIYFFGWLIPSRFYGALTYVIPLLCGKIFLVGVECSVVFIQYCKKIQVLAMLLLVPVVLNLLLLYIFVPRYGINGAIVAYIASYAIYFIAVSLYNWRLVVRRFAL